MSAPRVSSELDVAIARKRVKELKSFYMAWVTWAMVCSVLWVINLTHGSPWWAQWPTMGWGGSLAVWGLFFVADKRGLGFGPAWEERKVQQLMAGANIQRLSSEKQHMQAQLRTLQAQIEPHFLFNTLAHVQSLIGREPAKAEAMLDAFIGHLRQSLNASRALAGTLGQELQLVQQYLQIMHIRMGQRLQVAIDVPADLHSLPLAPMLLQPLVENAIRHGLEPQVAGGTVWVRAQRVERGVQIDVADDGLGFAAAQPSTSGGGVGLANLRQRLGVLYDGRASIEVLDAKPGTTVRLWLPVQGQKQEA